MATLAYTFFNYETQVSTDIRLIKGQNKFKCFEQLQDILLNQSGEIFTIESFKDYEPKSNNDFIEWLEFVNGELMEIDFVLITNFV